MKTAHNCRGDLELNTGCGFCGKCLATAARLKREHRLEVSTQQLQMMAGATSDFQLLEVIRLAHVGLWAEVNSVEINDALEYSVRALPLERATKFQRVINARPVK